MRPFVLSALVAILSIASGDMAHGQALTAKEGKLLNGTEIKKTFGGSKITGVNQYGNDYIVSFSPDGKMSGQAIDPDGVVVAEDTGTWSTRRNQYCREWETWFDGFPACFLIVMDGETVKFFGQNRQKVDESTLVRAE
ncbi:MAG: hypothetical protein AAGH45_05005 [Pseudomonadota bacterium]